MPDRASSRPARGVRHGSAGRQAREVVGLYGDPDTTWGICLELGFGSPLAAAEMRARTGALVAAYPHLGREPSLEVVADEEWAGRREELAAAPYAEDGPLVRLAMSGSGTRLLVAAHHGACDGLGLVALAGRLAGVELVSLARGIGDRPAPQSFLRSSLARLREALLDPPPRFATRASGPTPSGGGEHLRTTSGPPVHAGTVELCVAIASVFAAWNATAAAPLLVMGASRRSPGALAPDRQTAYLRLRVDPAWDRDHVREAFRAVAPEPEFPETSVGGIGPRITRLLRSRLGATAQLSNLGVIDGDDLVSAAMFPALSGPRGVAVGLVTTGVRTTVSLRTRASEFSDADTDDLLERIAAELAVAARQ